MILWRSWWARFAILAILLGAVFIKRTATTRAIAWSLGLAATCATGIGTLRMAGREREDMKRIAKADRFARQRKDGERIAVCGTIEADGEPLESPVWKRPAVLYHYAVIHREPRPHSDATQDVTDYAGYGATPARVEGTPLGGFPTLHGFEEKQISAEKARNNMEEYLRFSRFEEGKRGEIEWVYIGDDLWDGRAPVRRNFRCGEGRPISQCLFHEASVAPGERVCAIGTWSVQRGMLLEPKLYRGTKESVYETLSSAVGCGRFLGYLLIVASAAGAAYVAGVF